MTTEPVEPGTAGTAHTVDKPQEPKKSLGELRAEAHAARGEIASTFDAIEYKLNIPKQLKIRGRRFSMGLRNLGENNPAALAGIALGALAVVGGAIWLGIRAVQRR